MASYRRFDCIVLPCGAGPTRGRANADRAVHAGIAEVAGEEGWAASPATKGVAQATLPVWCLALADKCSQKTSVIDGFGFPHLD
ncbi:UNVERIFIED_CONTAM: hypothetical protein Sindi_1045000 [Sesamum indicum]